VLAVFFQFGGLFEQFEVVIPEVANPLPELGQALRSRAVQPARSVTSLAHQPRALEDPKVLRDSRPRDVRKVRCDISSRPLAVAHEPQDRPSPRFGQRLKHSIGCHTQAISKQTLI
jgi:hypothetical protein